MIHKLLSVVFFSSCFLLFTNCDLEDSDAKALRDFYLSQPRDPRLVGKWAVFSVPEDTLTRYVDFNDDGYIYKTYRPDDEFNRHECWYTLGDFILKEFHYSRTILKYSFEYPVRFYKIEGEYLYFSWDGFSYDHRLRYKKVDNP